MQIVKVYDKRLKDKTELRLRSVSTFFPKQECAMIAFVNWKTLSEMMHHEYTRYFSLKSNYSIEGEQLFAVGLSRKNAKISGFDVKYVIINK